MTITPETARELLDFATPGPWGRTGMGALTDTGGKVLVNGPDGNMDDSDADLASVAPDMAETIAGMTEEWGVERDYRSGTETDTVWFPSEDEAREDLSNPHRQNGNPRLVRRLVGPAEPIAKELTNDHL